MPQRSVAIKSEQQTIYSALVLLKKIHAGAVYDILLEGNNTYLESLFEYLLSHENIKIEDNQYKLTEQGEKTLNLFRRRYTDFLRTFDVYSAVDLAVGTFGFEKYWAIESEDEWEAYLDQENWEDLRIAVCEYKNIDPLEMVFLSFVNEDRFEEEMASSTSGWQFDLTSGTIWEEAVEIVSTALRVEDLRYETPEGEKISGTDVITDIIKQGAALNLALWEKEDEKLQAEDPFSTETDPRSYREYSRNPKHKSNVWDDDFFN